MHSDSIRDKCLSVTGVGGGNSKELCLSGKVLPQMWAASPCGLRSLSKHPGGIREVVDGIPFLCFLSAVAIGTANTCSCIKPSAPGLFLHSQTKNKPLPVPGNKGGLINKSCFLSGILSNTLPPSVATVIEDGNGQRT